MCGFSVYTGGDKMLRLSVAREFQKIKYRGPEKGWMGFHRLKIIDTSDDGNQPLIDKNLHLVANGEVYNYQSLMGEYRKKYTFQSESDCEVIIPMYRELGMLETARRLDYGHAADGKIMFASEMKALSKLCADVMPFPPGYIYDGEQFICFNDIAKVESYTADEMEEVYVKINDLLTKGVEKRLHADVPVGRRYRPALPDLPFARLC